LPRAGRKSYSSYIPHVNPLDSYRQPSPVHDTYHKPQRYTTHPERETPSGFHNQDPGEICERKIERVRRALDNYEPDKPERSPRVKDIDERLDNDDWRTLDADLMTRWFKEKGNTLSETEKSEFTEVLLKKLTDEAGELKEVDSQIIKLEAEMLENLGEIKSMTEGLDILERTNINEHGTELEPDSEDQNDIRQAEIQTKEVFENFDEIDDSTETAFTVEIEAPADSAGRIAAEITSNFEKAGYDVVPAEADRQDAYAESQFKSLEAELDSPLVTHPETMEQSAPETIELSFPRPEITGTVQPEVKKNLEAESSEVGNGEFG
jgi:hypothetical protein